MSNLFVSGLINLEVTLRVDSFPVEYAPVKYPFHGVNSSVSGVGFNIAKALATLGDNVEFASIIGTDVAGKLARQAVQDIGISTHLIVEQMEHTPHSVIVYDRHGNRQINVDLKDIQKQAYPEDVFERASKDCALAVLCNINFSRPLLRAAKQAGKRIATDVHSISELDDEYNQDFMRAADILFMSDALLPCSPEEWAKKILSRYGNEIIVVGLGAAGVLLSVKSDGFLERVPAVPAPKIVNTIGAGDALFSAFVHFFNQSADPYEAIRKAAIFAALKLGESCAASGFVDEETVNRLYSGKK